MAEEKINICDGCVHLDMGGCVPTCTKELHKSYDLIKECQEFMDKERTDHAISRIETILFETELGGKEKKFVLETMSLYLRR